MSTITEFDPTACGDELGCSLQSFSTDQLIRFLFTTDSNGCLQLRVKTDISLDVDAINVELAGVETLLTAIKAIQTDKTQFTKITDGTDTLLVNPNGGLTAAIDQSTPGSTNLVVNKQAPDATATYSLTPYASAALEASAVVKASAGNLYGFVVGNNNASIRYAMVFNAISLPVNGTVPVIPGLPVQGNGGTYVFGTGPFPNFFSTGIVIALSTTPLTLTIAGNDGLFYVQKA